MLDTVFTIGHSTHKQDQFLALLRKHDITAICDVRSKPYSRVNPQFNRENLEEALLSRGIEYRFLGKELGGRSDDERCYRDGKVQYDLIAKTELFKDGLKKVLRGLKQNFRIALMCAEKEPLECHRTILVARSLSAYGLDVQHIHADGKLETHDVAMSRLARMLDLREQDLIHTREELLAVVYRKQAERIAYEAAPTSPGNEATVKGAAG